MCLTKYFKSKKAAKKFIEGQILEKRMVVYKGLCKKRKKIYIPLL